MNSYLGPQAGANVTIGAGLVKGPLLEPDSAFAHMSKHWKGWGIKLRRRATRKVWAPYQCNTPYPPNADAAASIDRSVEQPSRPASLDHAFVVVL